ncbi:beta-N-acetylhexosaminidase [Arachidicoccus ginsenosidimutans]|uniref:beta-N-acetylhexosaminidase n=1 Tax=Arachidicoccus sp. BS20 TaxID=1850526 RepID=UPI0007F15875|nr:beta-N-acetylhexosaminidase [Arachidicoccus sp. BS20]ANI90135.1 beta-N-acetylhexosaminidase [Arachidicoccus sp. BS20]
MKKLFFYVMAVCVGNSAFAQGIHIIPEPESVTPVQATFTLSANTNIIVSDKSKTEKTTTYLNDYLKKYYSFSLPDKSAKINYVAFRLAPNTDTVGSYTLDVTKDSIVITSGNEQGLFYGMQTLIQLLPTTVSSTLQISGVIVKDAPRLAYRGMMLDCGRHFMPVDFVKKYIDYLALHKFNTFHWHLTEDQGWRIEIKKYPRLTKVGAWRNGTIIGHHPGTGNDDERSGGFYTQKEIKDVVKYAADRYITIIPEIEMPGHSSAAIAAYPQLSCFPDSSTEIQAKVWSGPRTGKQVQQSWGVYPDIYAPTEYTFKFVENVLDEVIKLFPSKYIHIGGDEAPKDYWNKSPYCQQLMKNLGLKNADELQSYFIQRVEKYLNSKGRQIIGWDEILEGGLAPNATIMSWRGEDGGIAAAQQHHNVIMSPGGWMYIDHSQMKHEDSLTIGGYLPIQRVYSYNPFPAKLTSDEHKYIEGVQANVWTEYMSNPAKVEYMVFPRMAAVAEVGWTQLANKNYNDFKTRLQDEISRYKLWGVNYCTKWDNQPDTK